MTKDLEHDVQVTLVGLNKEFGDRMQNSLGESTLVVTVPVPEAMSYSDGGVDFDDGKKHIVAILAGTSGAEIDVLPPEVTRFTYGPGVEFNDQAYVLFRKEIEGEIEDYRRS